MLHTDTTDARVKPPRLQAVSLFTGAGGLDVGLERTGRFDILAAVELQESFCRSLEINRDAGHFGRSDTVIRHADLAQLKPEDLMRELGLAPGELDLLVGGPPCQSFSTAGRRRTVQDSRGQLLWDYLRFIDVFQPKAFLMENVRGLLSAALRHRPMVSRPDKGGSPLNPEELPGSVVRSWIEDLLQASSEYRVDSFEVNAVNYGAPQLRERVLFIGNRLGRRATFPIPTHGPEGSLLPPYRSLADALHDFVEDDPVLMDFSPRKKRYLSHVPEGGNWRTMPERVARESMGQAYYAKGGRSGWWRRLSWDLPCPTITTLPNHSSTSMCHPSENRVLSVGEFARVQEFPRKWVFEGTPQEQMKQVGNAVPTRLGEVAGEVIANLLDRGMATAPISSPKYVNTYLGSHVRTRQWWKNGRAVIRGADKNLAG